MAIGERTAQLSARIAPIAVDVLRLLCRHYGEEYGFPHVTQADALERIIMEEGRRVGIVRGSALDPELTKKRLEPLPPHMRRTGGK